jgi:hypothetical protein
MKVANESWTDFYDLPRDSIDVVFLGNSHNFNTFQPAIIDKIVPINSYTVGTSGADVFVVYYELKEILKYQHPQIVVLETYAVQREDKNNHTIFFQFLDAANLNSNRIAIANRYLSLKTLYSIIPALRVRMKWDQPYLYIKKLVGERESKPLYADTLRGASPSFEVIDEDDYNERREAVAVEPDAPSLNSQTYLDNLYQLCKENNIRLILTSVPTVDSFPNPTQYYSPAFIAQYAAENDIDLVTYDLSRFNHLHFCNGSHVNLFGADYISIEMAKKLAETLDLPVDETALAYYESFLFSDYSISKEGNDFIYNLVPQKENLSLKYKWQILSDDSLVFESDWQNSSSYRFSLNKDGSYWVRVSVRDPVGYYQLTAFFPLKKED